MIWEKFGSCYLAMKINSLVKLGCDRVSLKKLHQGAWFADNFSDLMVRLKPVSLVQSASPMHKNQPSRLLALKTREPFDWTTGSFVVWNAPAGEAIDSWACYETDDECLVIDVDQRKAVGKKVGPKELKLLVERARAMIPTTIEGKEVSCIVGIFSGKAELAQKMEIPASSFLVTKAQSVAYHGIFASYGPANPYRSVNDPDLTQSTLASMMRGKDSATLPSIARKILEERNSKRFVSEEDLRNRPSLCGQLEGIKFSEFLEFDWDVFLFPLFIDQ
mgnify:CR=1 FL=1